MTERDAPSGDVVKLVDELLSGSFETMEQVDAARAALLDYIAAIRPKASADVVKLMTPSPDYIRGQQDAFAEAISTAKLALEDCEQWETALLDYIAGLKAEIERLTKAGKPVWCAHENISAAPIAERQMTDLDREVRGTYRCPLCGEDTPHHHSAEEQQKLRGCWEAFQAKWLRNPPWYSDDGDDRRWQLFKSGWVAARESDRPAQASPGDAALNPTGDA